VTLDAALGRPVVVKTKGHGSVLTETGVALRDALSATLEVFEASIAQEERALEERLAALTGTASPRIRLALSHDPLLMGVLEALPEIEVAVAGSRESVERLLAGRVDAAGFHAGDLDVTRTPPYDALFQKRGLVVRPLFTREQGLMLAPGNPLRVHSIEDLARSKARFVNRQRGSGTRLWFDTLLERAGLSPSDVVGYEQEEFTHQAVAAVIASGAADAGMGVHAVAERFGLDFLPIGHEVYYFAVRTELSGFLDQLNEKIAQRLGNAIGYAANT
jgi:molybdate-binding protein